MERRYQVFISSTFVDLKDERQAALKAILELDHMPAGMELFPATDDTAWQLIKDVIDASDYYVLIVGGRYGSLDEAGIGYTEKEYEYALSAKKAVIALFHQKPDNLPREKTETNEASWQKLADFRAKVEKKHTCVYWNSAEELKARLIVSLTSTTKRHPAVGWVRADEVPDQSTLADILALRKRITELESLLQEEREGPPPGTENLMQGDETFDFQYNFYTRETIIEPPFSKELYWKGTVRPSWNQIFAAISPALIHESSDENLRAEFKNFLEKFSKEALKNDKNVKGKEPFNFSFQTDEITTCIVQFRALGLIQESQKKRSVHDKGIYWALTRFGDLQMIQLRAIRRTPPPPVQAGEVKPGTNDKKAKK